MLDIGGHGFRTAIDRMRCEIRSHAASGELFGRMDPGEDTDWQRAMRRRAPQFRLGTMRLAFGDRV